MTRVRCIAQWQFRCSEPTACRGVRRPPRTRFCSRREPPTTEKKARLTFEDPNWKGRSKVDNDPNRAVEQLVRSKPPTAIAVKARPFRRMPSRKA